MSAGTTAGRLGRLRRRVMPAALISLTAGLGSMVHAPQVALAASQGGSSIAAGSIHSCAIEDGKAYCWGYNGDGELGNGSTTSSRVPVAVDASGALAGQTLTQISALDGFTCALDTAGDAYCWGINSDGQLGNNSTNGSSVPVAVDTSGALAGQTLTQISAGLEHTCALASTGRVYCWGLNDSGQLGNNTTNDSSVPVAVDTSGVMAGQTLTQIAAGEDQLCALDSAGTVYCWGDNEDGQLGDDSTTSSSVPVAVDASGVMAGQTLTQIAAGQEYACALDSTGAAYCWGADGGGELGNSKFVNKSVPVPVYVLGALADKTLTQISAGGNHTCAMDSAGAIYCWGQNSFGELGDDATAADPEPVLTGPGAPTSVTAATSSTSATVSWVAPASLDGGTLTGYTATASPGGPACSSTTATTCTITGINGLADGSQYDVTVVARTTSGDSGASAPYIIGRTPTGPIVAGVLTTKCVSDSGDSSANDTPVVMGDCNSSAGQNWTVETDGTIQTNGKCMDIYRDSKANKAPVELWDCTGGGNQQWQASNGTLVNPVSGKCLDDPRFNATDGIQLEIYTCNGGSNQQWQLP